MTDNTNIYSDLFAYRFSLLDELLEEDEIIKELKYYLLDRHINENDIDLMLFDFYQSNNIDISYETISSIQIINNRQLVSNIIHAVMGNPFVQPIFQHMHNPFEHNNIHDEAEILQPLNDNIINNEAEILQPLNDNNNIPNIPIIEYNNVYRLMIDILNILINGLNGPINPQTDVKVMTQEKDIIQLKEYSLENDLEDKCTLCMDTMNKDQYVTELNCKHIFHKDCFMQGVDELHNKCPLCREMIGTAKYDI